MNYSKIGNGETKEEKVDSINRVIWGTRELNSS